MRAFVRRVIITATSVGAVWFSATSYAGVIFGSDGDLGGGFRWDADEYEIVVDGETLERSLDGGLRYSLQGGSVEAYRDLFTWAILPTIPQLEMVIDLAFAAWTAVDPESGLGTVLSFVDDTVNTIVSGCGLNCADVRGAEIDLLADTANDSGTRATSYFWASAEDVTLTSGTVDYAPGAIIGADININNNTGAVYTLDLFQRLLTHEIGHALGLGDLEDFGDNGFIDDNFDPLDPVGTLTNSWASLVNPLDPSASAGLTQYAAGTVTTDHLAIDGVDLLMESWGLGIGSTNPITNPVPLTADEYGMRQFLYPMIQEPTEVSEPSTLALLMLGIISLLGSSQLQSRRRRH